MRLSVRFFGIALLAFACPAPVFAADAAAAFDRASWGEKRALFAGEATRLRTAFAGCEKRATAPAEEVVVPIETFSNGTVRLSVTAHRAQFFLDEGLVWGRGVEISRYQTDRRRESHFKAEACLIDREMRGVWMEGAAEVTDKLGVLRGTNVYFSVRDNFLVISDGLRLRVTGVRGARDHAAAPGVVAQMAKANVPVEVAAPRGTYDRGEGVLELEGRARLDYGTNCTLVADRLMAFFASTNDLRCVEAEGDVVLVSGERTGRCHRATFERDTGLVEMFTGPGRERVEFHDGAARAMYGRKVRLWTNREQVEVLSSELVLNVKAGAGKGLLGSREERK